MTGKSDSKPYLHTFLNKIVYAVITFIANSLITRALGVSLKGDHAWILNVANIVAVVSGLGVYQSIPYFSRKAGEDRNMIGEYVNIFALQNLIYVFISVLILMFTDRDPVLALILILAIADIYSQQLNMLMLIENIFIRNKIFVCGAWINLGASALCYCFFKENLAFSVMLLVVVKIFYMVSYSISLKEVPRPYKLKGMMLWEKVRFGYLPMLSFLLITLNYKVDVLMLRMFANVTVEERGYYAAGVSLAELAWFIPDVFKEVLFSKTAKNNNYREIAAIIRISNLVMLFIIGSLVIFGKLLISIFYGKVFLPSYKVTVLLFLGVPAMSWFKIIQTLFNAQGRRWMSFGVLLVGTILNIAFNSLLIPYIGMYGAAGASILSYGVCGIFYLLSFAKISGTKLKELLLVQPSDYKILLNDQWEK